jgi:hypothetical protein
MLESGDLGVYLEAVGLLGSAAGLHIELDSEADRHHSPVNATTTYNIPTTSCCGTGKLRVHFPNFLAETATAFQPE